MRHFWFNTVDLVGLSLTVLRERREGFVCVLGWGRDPGVGIDFGWGCG